MGLHLPDSASVEAAAAAIMEPNSSRPSTASTQHGTPKTAQTLNGLMPVRHTPAAGMLNNNPPNSVGRQAASPFNKQQQQHMMQRLMQQQLQQQAAVSVCV